MALVDCPECRRQVSDRARACPQCGCPIHSSTVPEAMLTSGGAVVASQPLILSPLQEIAYRQKLVLYAVLINILSQLPLWAALQSPWLSPLGWLLLLANGVFSCWCMFKLLKAVRMPVALILLFSIGLFVPGLSILVLMLVVGRATRALQKAGVRVGLLGANLAAVP
jgi:hypothetical protein